MTRDAVVLGIVVVAFAALLTCHVAIALGLARRQPRRRALLAFVVAPLAPWLAWKERMRFRGVMWVVSAIAYGVALCLALQ